MRRTPLRVFHEISDAIREDVRPSAQTYGVEVRRADVKDIAFPGNLREIMNRVIETERQTEAQLIQAKGSAEMARLQAQNAAEIARINAATQAEVAQKQLEADQKTAALVAQNPQILELKELEVLREIGARGGSHFYVGVDKLGARTESM